MEWMLSGVAILVALVTLGLVARMVKKDPAADQQQQAHDDQMRQQIQDMARLQTELVGRLSQLSDHQARSEQSLSERLQAQERAVTKTLEDRLSHLTHRIGEGMMEQTKSTAKQMTSLAERLAVIDTAQKNITDLSQQMVSLQDILSNKQNRGAFGEVQLEMLVTNALPPSAYQFQHVLSNGKRVDCLLDLPNPPGAICLDSKFPLESFRNLRAAETEGDKTQAARQFRLDVLKHIKDIADKYIIAGETAESALMFLPSESVYAELHAHFPDVVEKSYLAKVWIVSPTTLMATLNTVRAVLKDARMREEAGRIQSEVMALLQDVGRLDDRVAGLERHFSQSVEDMRKIRISTDKITRKGEKIEEIQLGEDSPASDLNPPTERIGG